jgi:catechol 2,3-dioxygenase-like lactoylglutathione lyase family enzyme
MKGEEKVMPTITGIHHVSITVPDIEKSVPWYSEVLGLTKLMEEQHPDGVGYAVVLGTADWRFCIGLHTHPTNEGERFAETRTGLDHVGFLVPGHAELEAWEARLTEFRVEHSPIKDVEGFAVLVFRDPDNVQLEFMTIG